jgi:hypothetical protein
LTSLHALIEGIYHIVRGYSRRGTGLVLSAVGSVRSGVVILGDIGSGCTGGRVGGQSLGLSNLLRLLLGCELGGACLKIDQCLRLDVPSGWSWNIEGILLSGVAPGAILEDLERLLLDR